MTPGGNTRPASSWPAELCAPVRDLPKHTHLWVALSGGLDSTLLLHVAAYLHGGTGRLSAVHINHQLQPNAGATEAHCRRLCESLKVPLTVERVTVPTGTDAPGLEEAARDARYGVFERLLEPGHLLLMAHHGDDQVETVLFRLLRGTGVTGLAGVPSYRALGRGMLFRPLLGFTRAQLHQWAAEAAITWVDDPSNTDDRFDRNFLRHAVLPLLQARWPSLARRVGHTAAACRDSEELATQLARIRYREAADERGTLSVETLAELSLAEQANLLRWWIGSRGFQVPAVTNWAQVMGDLLQAAEDREPELRGAGFALRRFQGRLYLVPDQPDVPPRPQVLRPGERLAWGNWRLALLPVGTPQGQAPPIRVSTRAGGERIRTHDNRPSRPLKKWLQEQQVPPWERCRLPVLTQRCEAGDEVVGVGDLWLSRKYCGPSPESGWRIVVEQECD